MGDVSLPVTKRLFAESGNRCAFPECKSPLITEAGVVTGRICHIHAANENGPRWDPSLGDKRHEFDNLLLMCGPHHDEIDKQVEKWPASKLHSLKKSWAASTASSQQDVERVSLQLLELLSAEMHGVSIGSINAQNVAVIGHVAGSVSVGGSAESESLRRDRVNFNSLIKLADKSLIPFLREQELGGSFSDEYIQEIGKILRSQGELQAEFFDQEVESVRLQFRTRLRDFSSQLSRYGVTDGHLFRITTEDEFVRAGKDWDTARDLVQTRTNELDKLAAAALDAFKEFVKVGRSKLI